ncbi:NFAT activation molecule 1 [Leuresthes tenuis]|uniref:NFAT activation molecule 1 n=1 Tax=Leuresthes tenuis TaxID=355514 RepID=UPI003B5053A1
MEAQHFGHLSLMLTWILLFALPSVCTGMGTPVITLKNRVFLALPGEDLRINCTLEKPANQTQDYLSCFGPSQIPIYNVSIVPTTLKPVKENLLLQLKNLSSSGRYCCKYKTAKVSWFLRVTGKSKEGLVMLDYPEIIVAVFTGVLLVFSVVGSVYVFRGHWKERNAASDTADQAQKQKTERRRDTEIEKENMAVTTAQSTSFYASLEPRPRSIYDVLEPSAARTEPDQNKANSKKKEHPKMVVQPAEDQDEGVFESVYENF